MSFVDHIEFVKGPAGFMLANGDPSGLYNVVTKKPTGQTKGEIAFTLGSFDLYRTSLDLDGKLSKDGRSYTVLTFQVRIRNRIAQMNFNNRYAIAPVISYQLDDKTKLTLEYKLSKMARMSDVGSSLRLLHRRLRTLPPWFHGAPRKHARNQDKRSQFLC
jgi:iron complex outermembrane receptor protein